METLPPALRPPVPPDTTVDWAALCAYPWVRALDDCPQDPIHHAEGDVGLHTRMVLAHLAGMSAWQALPERDRAIVWLGALMHDIGKPATTEVRPDGRVTSVGHSRLGDRMARRILWELGVEPHLRESVCGLIRYHQLPFFLVDQRDADRRAFAISYATRADWLALVAEADIRGRHTEGIERISTQIALFVELCAELACLKSPRVFPDDHTRAVYFRSEGRDPSAPIYDDTRAEMVLLSGLPASGKDSWARANLSMPAVSLDDLRAETGTDPADNQGAILQLSRERMKEHLRKGQPFAFNATNLDRQRRGPLLQLAFDYHFRVRIVYVETDRAELYARNRARPEDRRVPERVISRMLDRWELPTLTEAQRVDWVFNGPRAGSP